jgi:hypothetical protein
MEHRSGLEANNAVQGPFRRQQNLTPDIND